MCAFGKIFQFWSSVWPDKEKIPFVRIYTFRLQIQSKYSAYQCPDLDISCNGLQRFCHILKPIYQVYLPFYVHTVIDMPVQMVKQGV